jgi:hypothetical protein
MESVRRFQFTLTTAIIASFVAGGVIYLHVHPTTVTWLLLDSLAIAMAAIWRLDLIMDRPYVATPLAASVYRLQFATCVAVMLIAAIIAVGSTARLISDSLTWWGI